LQHQAQDEQQGRQMFGLKVPGIKGSLAYRTNRDSIWNAELPAKYTRLLGHIHGARVLELGAAEGVLALQLAQQKEKVVALEMKKDRHEEAVKLQEHRRQQGLDVDRCEMVYGSILDRLDLLEQVDCLVGIRSIYYLRDRIDEVFAAAARNVRHVTLCGNKNRAARYFETNGESDDKLGKYNFYASIEGMTSVLGNHGYTITRVIADGDPIVVAEKRSSRFDRS
jgi:precorrin-6B methylase 2